MHYSFTAIDNSKTLGARLVIITIELIDDIIKPASTDLKTTGLLEITVIRTGFCSLKTGQVDLKQEGV